MVEIRAVGSWSAALPAVLHDTTMVTSALVKADINNHTPCPSTNR